VVALLVAACQRDHGDLADRLDRIEKRLTAIDRKLDSSGRPAAAAGRPPERPRPNPELTYSIPVDRAPSRGSADALVTIVAGYEFACPYCEQARPLIDQLLETYGNQVRVAYKTFLVHPQRATIPALAGCAAERQGKFHAMEALIWDKGFKAGGNLAADHMEKLAVEAGLNLERFKADMEGAACKQIEADHVELGRVGVSGTPAFFVNGRWVARRSMDEFKRLIDQELELARERVAAGTKPADYYREWVVEKGRKQL
jgi:protein-disulfide isomerase